VSWPAAVRAAPVVAGRGVTKTVREMRGGSDGPGREADRTARLDTSPGPSPRPVSAAASELGASLRGSRPLAALPEDSDASCLKGQDARSNLSPAVADVILPGSRRPAGGIHGSAAARDTRVVPRFMKSLWTTITGAGNGRLGRSAGVEGITRERVGPPGSRDTGVNGVPARGAPEFATTPPESPPRTGVNAIAGAAHAALAA
jgi:hypothetical protein